MNYDYETPDIGRENYEACREEEREVERDRYTVAEAKELEAEEQALIREKANDVAEAMEEARNNVAIDHANDMKI